tara:strand:+ start:9505 stop:9795 length:291 start_codon:yes stop_codon:yes gene_type:complete
MSKVFELELRIENNIISWLRNSIILIALSISLKSFGGDKMYLVSNLAIFLSLFILVYLYIKISKSKKYFKHIYKINNINLIVYGLFIVCILVLFKS